MNAPLISVIIPIYNVANYLDECICSVLHQSYMNLEIILVDDGSTDNSSMMCDHYAQQDSRVVVIHQVNGGLSVARNSGLDQAKGDYIAFVDSDDIVNKDYIRKLYDLLIEYQADISICNLQMFTEVVNPHCDNRELIELFGLNFVEKLYEKGWRMKSVVMWNKLYHKDIFENLRFPENLVHEDAYVFLDIFNELKERKIVYTSLILYYYRQDVLNSIMSSDDLSPKRFYSLVEVHNRRIDIFMKKGQAKLLRKERLSQASLYTRSILKNRNIEFIKDEIIRNKKILIIILFGQKGFRSKLNFLKILLFSK